jgi:EmrB/QacA subfamily drug resistance transporter
VTTDSSPLAEGATTPVGNRRAAALTVCCLGAFMAFLDTTIVNFAFPGIAETFHSADLTDISWVVNVYNIVIAAFVVPAGRIADRLGRKRSFIAGLLVFTGASAACGAAGSVEFLVAARLVQAAGAAILVPTSLALLLPEFAPSHRLSAVALWGAASALAAGVGPSLGGVLIDVSSWRVAFLVNIPIGLIAAWGAHRLLKEERERGPLPDLAGAALLAIALGAMALGIVKGEEWHWTSAATLGCLIGSAALLVVVAARCAHHAEPVIDPELVSSRVGAVGNLGTLLFSIAFYATLLNNVLFLTAVWHWSVLTAGLAISPSPLIAAAVARPAGRLAERLGERAVIIPGVVVYVIGVLLLAWGAGESPDFLTHWLPGGALAGLGLGFAYPNLVGSALAAIPARRLATGIGINSAARQFGGVLGTALLISVLAAGGNDALSSHQAGWFFAVSFAIAAGATALLLPSHCPAPAEDA